MPIAGDDVVLERRAVVDERLDVFALQRALPLVDASVMRA